MNTCMGLIGVGPTHRYVGTCFMHCLHPAYRPTLLMPLKHIRISKVGLLYFLCFFYSPHLVVVGTLRHIIIITADI